MQFPRKIPRLFIPKIRSSEIAVDINDEHGDVFEGITLSPVFWPTFTISGDTKTNTSGHAELTLTPNASGTLAYMLYAIDHRRATL